MTEVEFDTEGVKKTITYLNRKAPYGTIYALEVLESVLISAAFEQHANIVFVDDGVFQIKKGQDTADLDMNLGVLFVRNGKFGKERYVPLHSTNWTSRNTQAMTAG